MSKPNEVQADNGVGTFIEIKIDDKKYYMRKADLVTFKTYDRGDGYTYINELHMKYTR